MKRNGRNNLPSTINWMKDMSCPHLFVALHLYKPPSTLSLDWITSVDDVNFLSFSSLLRILGRESSSSSKPGMEKEKKTCFNDRFICCVHCFFPSILFPSLCIGNDGQKGGEAYKNRSFVSWIVPSSLDQVISMGASPKARHSSSAECPFLIDSDFIRETNRAGSDNPFNQFSTRLVQLRYQTWEDKEGKWTWIE